MPLGLSPQLERAMRCWNGWGISETGGVEAATGSATREVRRWKSMKGKENDQGKSSGCNYSLQHKNSGSRY
ncbi:MAG: hypothetical protein MUC60_05205 [Oscillatoria sp. Prado101]|nr:hypothetical protein [Oscillatoria sp. Prado101]